MDSDPGIQKKEPGLDGRPFNGGTGLDEITPEVLRLIDDCCSADAITAGDFAAPLNIEGDGGRDRSDWRDGRICRCCSLTVSQGVGKVVRIGNGETFHLHRSSR